MAFVDEVSAVMAQQWRTQLSQAAKKLDRMHLSAHRLQVAHDRNVRRLHEKVRDFEALLAAVRMESEEIGRLMHESWSQTKRAQGFHGPAELCPSGGCVVFVISDLHHVISDLQRCLKFHADLVQWEALPAGQQDINRHAFDHIFAEIRRRATAAGLPEAAWTRTLKR